MSPATVLGQQNRIRTIPRGMVFTMPVIVWGIASGNFLLPLTVMLVLLLTVLQPPLPPPEVSDHCKCCKHDDQRHRVIDDKGK